MSEVEVWPEDIYLTDAGKLKAWRLLSLIDAFRVRFGTPTLDDIDQLGVIASGRADLHEACDALKNGCRLEHALEIYT